MGTGQRHYGAIDGLRTVAAISIVMMHAAANNEYGIVSPSSGVLYGVYGVFADLTLLSGFLPNAGNITAIGVGWLLGVWAG